MLKFTFLLFVLSCCHARLWNNPVLDGGDYPDPGVINVDGVYYAVTTTNNEEYEKYPIHSSTDLQNWKLEGYVFNQSNFPSWSGPKSQFWAPEIHKVGDGYRAYFTSRKEDGLLVVGAAAADNVLGPYKPIDGPLVEDPEGEQAIDSTLVHWNGKPVLIWCGHGNFRARNLTDDGLSFADDTILDIMTYSLPWEGITVEGPWYVYRNGWHYIFYSANYFCGPDYVVGVARSRESPLGPFEKKPDPILRSTDVFIGPGHGSIVRDIDGEGWVFVYHGWKAGNVCGSNWRLMFTSQVEWGDDDWPKDVVI